MKRDAWTQTETGIARVAGKLRAWAQWCAAREDHGLGYKASALSRSAGGGDAYDSARMPAVEHDIHQCLAVERAVRGLPVREHRVIMAEYLGRDHRKPAQRPCFGLTVAQKRRAAGVRDGDYADLLRSAHCMLRNSGI